MTTESPWFAEYEGDPDYLFELAALAVGEAIVGCMESLGLTRSELARRLGVSRPRITQILAGDDNLTLKTIVAVAAALGSRLDIEFVPLRSQASITPSGLTRWRHVEPGPGIVVGNRELALAA